MGKLPSGDEQIDAAGDKVFLFLHVGRAAEGSGIEVEARYAHVWTMRGGKGVRVDAYADRELALKSLGETERGTLTFRAPPSV